MNLEEIIKKLSGYNIKKIEFKDVLKIIIEVESNANISFFEKDISEKLGAIKLSLIFVIKKNLEKEFKKIIGVTSNKGGVGKSTIALNIAFELAEQGYKIGLIDADLYAPSIPVFLNLKEVPISNDGIMIEPIKFNEKIKVLSVGLFLKENQTTIFKNNLLESAFRQFTMQGNWNDCDYLIIDFPPGITQIHETCAKILKQIEMLLVCAPSKVVYSDVYKMFIYLKAMNFNISGLVENFSFFKCQNCESIHEYKTNFKIDGIETLIKLPHFLNFHELAENGYEKNYKLKGEKEYFNKLVNLIK